ncbi:hypothetical protein THMIRHAM_02910 [Thiomicrorhabdus immobilis]|uniref:Methyl-accepting chemotaxis protein n=1 Tax=Thiomicrorhabdus immobilis TaxID=2791037 RepID=A0ABN6CU65_9GAMM|nr:methyl-accepting chemotaxis protein [Thiomicrorhabdus immobilis]BCN92506.1 hypothetical protein THMIRHAM_02910 [Thiomicrorhabdus immobilis]
MFKTIRAKLIAGFSLITLLIILSAVFSVININESAKGFKDYRGMAKASLISSGVQTNMLMVRMNLKDYLQHNVQKEVDEFNQYYEKTDSFIKDAKQIITDPERNRMIDEIAQGLVAYREHFAKVQQLMTKRDEIVNNSFDVNGPKLEQLLTQVMQESAEADNNEVAIVTSKALRSLMLGRLYTSKFIYNHTEQAMNRVMLEFETLDNHMEQLINLVEDGELKGKLIKSLELINYYSASVVEFNELINNLDDVINNKLNVIGPHIAKLAEDIKSSLKADQDKIGPEVQANNENIINIMIVSALVVAIIAALIAFFLPRSIANGLASIQKVLLRISKSGDFSIRADAEREDEVGDMGQAVNTLLTDMQKAINEANDVITAISKGDFSQRVTAELSGDLNMLKEGINGSADSINSTMTQLSAVMESMSQGDFNVIINADVEGQFLQMVQNTRHTLQTLNDTIADIVNIMECMEKGDFDQRVTIEAHGDLLRLKEGVNNSMDSIQSAMLDITRIVVAQSEGDLTQSIEAEYFGQLDTLKQAVNTSSRKLVEVVSKALEATNIVGTAAEEVARGAADLSQRVQEQAAALEETSATMDEMNSAVQGNTENAQQASHVAKEVQDKAHKGVEVMTQTIDAMDSIQQSSHKIADIVTLIDGIAFQTNLLALNAAVEAARAGDHGRGFAVVAGEVRALAQKSAEAAKDIKKLIDESVTRIDDGTRLAGESGDVLTEINNSIETVSKMITQIAEASEEQAKGVSQVHQAVSQIDDVTQQNAALVEETSAAAESMNEQSDNLRHEMAFFHTGKSDSRDNGGAVVLAIADTVVAPVPGKVSQSNQPPGLVKPTSSKENLSKLAASDSDQEWEDF